ncbi:glutamate racemase [Clostridium cochlearium]|uniref:glutamate racemase n=1 Tax=Clostridium cochlearium TaxID=1494 RepID=UPI00241CAD64|nr:glutamate racemase [Clostridium cochlearium]
MITKDSAIGVLDSGVGGLTTVKELQELLPNENIYYFGDNKNVPYGNKTEEEIIKLTRKMIEFLISENVKVIAIACNTISTIIDEISNDYDVKIIKVIDPIVNNIKNIQKRDKVGLIATNFTVSTKYYDKMLGDVKVIGKGCSELAAIVDSGEINEKEVRNIIKTDIDDIKSREDVDTIILGCTHYPIIKHIFDECYPDVNFLNPAHHHAIAIKEYLQEMDLLKEDNRNKFFKIFTTGDKEKYRIIMDMLKLKEPDEIILK